MSYTSAHTGHDAMKACIDLCTSCHQTCLHNVRHCLEKGGTHADAAHIGRLLDCAQICATSADFMTRHSAHHAAVCGACAAMCRACAESCDALGDDQMMKQCAEECRRCAESCERMAAMA